MALTPYIWALWQTQTGKVIIICVSIILVVGTLIKAFGWWSILVVLLLVALVALAFFLERRDQEKEHQRKMKELNDEFERLRRVEKIMRQNNKL